MPLTRAANNIRIITEKKGPAVALGSFESSKIPVAKRATKNPREACIAELVAAIKKASFASG
jgi:hypothetical protein